MRPAFFAIIVLLFGCVSPPAQNQTAPGQNGSAIPAPQAEEEIIGNLTEPPPAPSPANLTNETLPANETLNGTAGNETAQSPGEPPPERPEGLLFAEGKYLLVLDDVSVIPSSEEPCGIFSIRNATDYSVYEKMLICPPDSQTWTSPDNHIFRIKVIKVAAGYSGGGNWVEVIIYG
jgi:hypothetical protein